MLGCMLEGDRGLDVFGACSAEGSEERGEGWESRILNAWGKRGARVLSRGQSCLHGFISSYIKDL